MSKGKVLIAKESASSWTTKNPHTRTNVNVAQGPRVGNSSAHDGKRGNFKAAKEERAPIADMIEKAYARRSQDDAVNSKLEPVKDSVNAKFKSSKK